MKQVTLEKLRGLYNMPNANNIQLSDEAYKRAQLKIKETLGQK